MRNYCVVALFGVFMLASAFAFSQSPTSQSREPIIAPTYYIAVGTISCEPDLVRFAGSSDLPPGAIIQIDVAEPVGDMGWKDYTDSNSITVDARGFFKGGIRPKEGMEFRGNLDLSASFLPHQPKQPPSVLAVMGSHGEYLSGVKDARSHLEELAGLSQNPQLYQVSGWYYGISDMSRAACPSSTRPHK